MTDGMNRRGFVRTGLAIATVIPSATLTWEFFRSPDCTKWMISQLVEHFQLPDQAIETAELFVRRLQDESYAQTESPQHVRDLWAKGDPTREDLAQYLVQEFAVTTNIIDFHNGDAAELEWLGYPSLDDNDAANTAGKAIG